MNTNPPTDAHNVPHVQSSTVKPCPARDATPKGTPVFELTLSYTLTMPAPGTITPFAARIHTLLYSSPFGSALVVISDAHNRLVGTADAFYEKIKLPAGTFTVRLQVKHENAALLEGMKTTALSVQQKLGSEVSLKTHASRSDACTAGGTMSATALVRGARCVL